MAETGDPSSVTRAFETERQRLWAICYRMCGSGADAEDLVQDTFERALRSPPPDTERDLGPWLVRVAVHASIDHLRRRKHERYDGPWLPGPIETPLDDPYWQASESPEARYTRLESVSFAFLCALEALTPTQRAVLLLRDVFDHSVRETAEMLEMSEPNVKTTLHRARGALEAYDAARRPFSRERHERGVRVLRAFLVYLATDDRDALRALLREDATMWNDGGGEFFAARKPVRGVDRILLFHQKTKGRGVPRLRWATLNGTPAVLFERRTENPKIAARTVLYLELDADDRIVGMNWIVASRKLPAHLFEGVRRPGPKDVLEVLLAWVRATLRGA